MSRLARGIAMMMYMLASVAVPPAIVGGIVLVLLQGQGETVMTAAAEAQFEENVQSPADDGSTLADRWAEENRGPAELGLSDAEFDAGFTQVIESRSFKRAFVEQVSAVGASWDEGTEAEWNINFAAGLAEVGDEIPPSLAAAIEESPTLDLGGFPNPFLGSRAVVLWLFVFAAAVLIGLVLVTQRAALAGLSLAWVGPYALVAIASMWILARPCSAPECGATNAMAEVVRGRLQPAMIVLTVFAAMLWLVFRQPGRHALRSLRPAR